VPKLDLDEDEIKRLVSKGYSTQQIADHMGCSARVIMRRRKELGMVGQTYHQFTPDEERQIELWLEDEVPLSEIARTLEVSEGVINSRYGGRGKNPSGKLMAECRELAAKLGM
jgi:IS30 family transposase